jgi:hypothetical protein
MSNAPAAGDEPGIGPSRRLPAALMVRSPLRLTLSQGAPWRRRGRQTGTHMLVLNREWRNAEGAMGRDRKCPAQMAARHAVWLPGYRPA